MTPLGEQYGPIVPFAMCGLFFLYAIFLLITKIVPHTRACREAERKAADEAAAATSLDRTSVTPAARD
jgi:hypothetical protein